MTRIITPTSGAAVARAPTIRLPDQPGSGDALARIGEEISAFGAAREQRNNAAALANFRVNAAKTLAEIDGEFDGDTDFDTLDARYETAMTDRFYALSDSVPPAVRNQAEQALQMTGIASSARTAHRARTLERDTRRAQTETALDWLIDQAIAAPDPTMRDALLAQARATIEDGVGARLYDPADAVTKTAALAETVETGMASRLLEEDPAGLIAALDGGRLQGVDPVARSKFHATATSRLEAATTKARAKLGRVERARAAGTVLENEDQIIAEATVAGIGDAAMRAVDRGRLIATIPDMTPTERIALRESLQDRGKASPADVSLIEGLQKIEADEIAEERKRVEKAGAARKKELDKLSKERRKEIDKLIDDNMTAARDNLPRLGSFDDARTLAHATGQGEEFERAIELGQITRLTPQQPTALSAAQTRSFGAPETLAEARALEKIDSSIESAETAIDADPVAVAAKSRNYGDLDAIDMSSTDALLERGALGFKISRDYGRSTAQFFTRDQRTAFSSDFAGADADAKAEALMPFIGMNNQPLASAMVKELGIADPMHAVAASRLVRTGDQGGFLEVFRGQQNIDEKIVKLPGPSVTGPLERALMGDILASAPNAQKGVMLLARSLYGARAGSIDPTDQSAQQELYEEVLTEALNGTRARLGSGDVLLPADQPPAMVQGAVDWLARQNTARQEYDAALDARGPDSIREGGAVPLTLPDADQPIDRAAILRAGTGGAPQIAGEPMTGEQLRGATFELAGEGLFYLSIPRATGTPVPVMRDDDPARRWIIDTRSTVLTAAGQ